MCQLNTRLRKDFHLASRYRYFSFLLLKTLSIAPFCSWSRCTLLMVTEFSNTGSSALMKAFCKSVNIASITPISGSTNFLLIGIFAPICVRVSTNVDVEKETEPQSEEHKDVA